MVDYSQGRYLVSSASGQAIGRIDGDEYVRRGPERLFRIDDDEVYDMEGKFLGSIEDGTATSPEGGVLFSIRRE